jgi:hypothetical protein
VEHLLDAIARPMGCLVLLILVKLAASRKLVNSLEFRSGTVTPSPRALFLNRLKITSVPITGSADFGKKYSTIFVLLTQPSLFALLIKDVALQFEHDKSFFNRKKCNGI